MYKISVIVPIYNAEKYLRRCLDSIINQTYDNLEIILINDGSKDNSIDICREYEKNDNRVVLIDKQNTGVSHTRNIGIDKASGDYIGFVDSDDWVDLRMFETLIDNIRSCDAEVAGIKWLETDGQITGNIVKNNASIVDNNIEKYLLRDNNMYCSVRYLYSKNLIESTRFDETMRTGEDQKFNYDVITRAKRIVVSDYNGYFYFQNDSSASNGVVKNNHYDDLNFRKNLIGCVNHKNKKLAKAHLIKGYLGVYIKALIYGYDCDENIVKKYGSLVRHNLINYWFLPNIGLKRKIAATCCLFGDTIMRKVSKMVL